MSSVDLGDQRAEARSYDGVLNQAVGNAALTRSVSESLPTPSTQPESEGPLLRRTQSANSKSLWSPTPAPLSHRPIRAVSPLSWEHGLHRAISYGEPASAQARVEEQDQRLALLNAESDAERELLLMRLQGFSQGYDDNNPEKGFEQGRSERLEMVIARGRQRPIGSSGQSHSEARAALQHDTFEAGKETYNTMSYLRMGEGRRWGSPPHHARHRLVQPGKGTLFFKTREVGCGLRCTTPPPVRRSQNASRGKGLPKAGYEQVRRDRRARVEFAMRH